jgi:nucleoid-associated protein YgaU
MAIGTAVVLLVAAAAVAATSGVAGPGSAGHAGGAGDAAGGSPTTAANAATRAPQGTERLAPSATPAGPSASGLGGSGPPAPTLAPAPTVRPTLVATRDLPAAWRGLEACPAPDACFLYVVRRGDTFSAIATRFETTTKRLRRLNPTLDDPNTIRVGSTIRVPPPPS